MEEKHYGPTAETRTDKQIAEEKARQEKSPYDSRQFPKPVPESYSDYKQRVSGLVDFVPLTEDAWRKETGQLSTKEQILADLGITVHPVIEVLVPISAPSTEPAVAIEHYIEIPLEPAVEAEQYFPQELLEKATVAETEPQVAQTEEVDDGMYNAPDSD
jgi:hypothetical protein